jgi:hypothetical protein
MGCYPLSHRATAYLLDVSTRYITTIGAEPAGRKFTTAGAGRDTVVAADMPVQDSA